MKFFSKEETKVLALILGVIVFVSFFNFRTSLRRQRDTERKDDLGQIADALAKYNNDFGNFPLSSDDGKIIACLPIRTIEPETTGGKPKMTLSPCEWGKDSLKDVNDPSFPGYLARIPIDPRAGDGRTYIYISNGKRYQIYAALEGTDEVEYNPKIVARKISCGISICNFGRSFGKTPLDKSLGEYENEINAK